MHLYGDFRFIDDILPDIKLPSTNDSALIPQYNPLEF